MRLSQSRLSEAIGGTMQQSDVSALERGRVTLPRRDRLERVAAALCLPLGELLARSGWADAERYFEQADPPEPRADDARKERLCALIRDTDMTDLRAVALESLLRSWREEVA